MAEQTCIGLLTPFFQPITAYERAAASLGVELAVVTPARIDWQAEQVEALVWSGADWQTKTVDLPRAFYNRFYGPKPKVVNRLELLVGKDKVFNHITHFDKLDVHRALLQSQLQRHLPAADAGGPKQALQFLETWKQIIVKPRRGRLGLDIFLIRQKGKRIFLHHGTKSPVTSFPSAADLSVWLEENAGEDFLVQQFVPLAEVDGRIFDVRILVQKDQTGTWQASGALSRLALSYSYVTNVSHAILPAAKVLKEAFPGRSLLPKLEAISLTAASLTEQALGSLGEISVDFGLDGHGNIWIMELNGKPMKSLFLVLGNARLVKTVYQRPLSYALHLHSPSS